MSVIVLTAPEEVKTLEAIKAPKIFLAGGISNCPDWQAEVIGKVSRVIEDYELAHGLDPREVPLVLMNPRRENFPIEDPNASMEQIAWEHRHLEEADCISFWFSKGSDNPIVLFEYGNYGFRPLKPVIVGVDPEYSRRMDVVIQTALREREAEILPSLALLVEDIVQFWKCWHELECPVLGQYVGSEEEEE